jgi:stage III sporulation protein AE
MISAVCKALQSNLRTESVARAFSFCTTAAIIVLLFSKGFSSMQATADYFQTLNHFTSASIPLMGGLYAIGGNVSSAVATSAGLTVFLTVLEEIVGRTVIPFCGICLALSMVNAMDSSVRVGTLLGSIKKNYTTLLSFLMMLLLAMLASQSILGAAKDTLAMRSAKFAAGSMIPVVGGSVAELIKTVSASVGYLRGTVGICGVLLLLLLLFPTLVELLLVRMTWQLGASLADLLGCDGEKKLLEEFASINGYLIAAVAICSSVLFFAFTIFMHCASAIA